MSRPDPRPTPDPRTPRDADRGAPPHGGGFGAGDLTVLAALILSALLIGLVAWIALTVSTPRPLIGPGMDGGLYNAEAD